MQTRQLNLNKKLSTYLDLVAEFPLVSIRSPRQLEAAQAVADRLLARGMLDAGEEMYLDALSELMAAYEDAHYPMQPGSDADMLRHLMDAARISQADLSRSTGVPTSVLSSILAGKTRLGSKALRSLADYFQIDAALLSWR
ncbi:MAG: helix-turn-helix transcriptional regulator [Pirellulales bacterium]